MIFWTNKRHPIVLPNGRTMRRLLRALRNTAREISRAHLIPDVDSRIGNDRVLNTIDWRNCAVAMLSDVFNNLEILNTPLILVITRRHLDITGDITQSTFWKTYWYYCQYYWSLQWRHNGRDGVSNHQPHYCLLNRLFRLRTKKTSNRWLANSPHKGPVTRKMFPFDDVIMCPGFLRHKPKND